MSLVALLMAIGIMMDDAIVIAESIAAHLERGLSVPDAVSEGVKKVFPRCAFLLSHYGVYFW